MARQVQGGITPACAGKRSSVRRKIRTAWDHPRVRGEKQVCPRFAAAWLGSPPRARGKVNIKFRTIFTKGITPACAGKRIVGSSDFPIMWDHPRVRGEKIYGQAKRPERKGSPPRARGKAIRICTSSFFKGITPACAGKRAARR